MTPHKKTETAATTMVRPVVLVTGMSGAGLSTSLKVFEDMGYEAVDNLRLGLVASLVEKSTEGKALAVSIDTRNVNFSTERLLEVLSLLRENDAIVTTLLFLECSDDVLQRRFTETRRRHPLALDRPVTDGIKRERELLWQIRDHADHVIDTSSLSVHDLRRLVAGHYKLSTESDLSIFVTSFSYRHGLPREADLVFDVRFLANPYWDATLRPQTGLDEAVAAYVMKDKDYQLFIDNLSALVLPLLPRYQLEGKSYLTLAIGCTGGRHRSVFVAEQLATILAGSGYIVGTAHRDLGRLGK